MAAEIAASDGFALIAAWTTESGFVQSTASAGSAPSKATAKRVVRRCFIESSNSEMQSERTGKVPDHAEKARLSGTRRGGRRGWPSVAGAMAVLPRGLPRALRGVVRRREQPA